MKLKRNPRRNRPALGKVRMIFNMAVATHAALKSAAAAKGVTVTAYLLAALRRRGIK